MCAVKVTKGSCRKCVTIFWYASRHLAVILGKNAFYLLKILNCILLYHTSYSFIPLASMNLSQIFKIKMLKASRDLFLLAWTKIGRLTKKKKP